MDPLAFQTLISTVTGAIASRALDSDLEVELNHSWAPGGPAYRAIFEACQTAIAAGWMCNRDGGGIKYGRVLKPTAATHGFSVDVVDMNNIVGPHHRHPNGEIDLVMPLTDGATFDGRAAGWVVYGPHSAHRPTVAEGRALILYLLPEGRIEFTPEPGPH
jgi:hypothetical protein